MSGSSTSTTRTCRAIPRRSSRHFLRAACFIKSGADRCQGRRDYSATAHKKTVWVNVKMQENPQVTRDIHQSFLKDYTVGIDNYPVRDYLAPNPFVIDVDVEA